MEEKTDKPRRRVEFDYLRTFAVIIVVFHHAMLAYTTYAEFSFSPVIDTQKWVGFDWITRINDIFGMSLFFFLSGLFVWESFKRKGVKKFLNDRIMKLGLGFLIALILIMPIAYYFSHLEQALIYEFTPLSFPLYWLYLASIGFIGGPLWFLWVLLMFNLIFVSVFSDDKTLKSLIGIKKKLTWFFENPFVFFPSLFIISLVFYAALAIGFGPDTWYAIGPLAFQVSRIMLYFVYFLIGTAFGMYGLDRSLLKTKSTLVKYWWVWLILSIISVTLYYFFNGMLIYMYVLIFSFACSSLVLGVVAIFVKFATKNIRVIESFNKNSFGIYIVHYVFVTLLQFLLLFVNLPAILKVVIVFVGALILSWGLIEIIRKIFSAIKRKKTDQI